MVRDRLTLSARSMAALAGGLLLTALLAACGSNGEAVVTPTAPAPSPTPTVAGAGALPLERFHYVASLTLRETQVDGEPDELFVSTEGDFQWPDRHAFTYTTQRGEGEIRQSIVIVGEKVWFRRWEEPWRETDREDEQVADLLNVAFSAVRPSFLSGPEFDRVRENVRGLPSTEEFVNAVRANHYRVGAEGRAFIESFLVGGQALQDVEDLEWDLWLAKDGVWPVRLLLTGTVNSDITVLDRLELSGPTAWELRIDISRPNDPDLIVETPETG